MTSEDNAPDRDTETPSSQKGDARPWWQHPWDSSWCIIGGFALLSLIVFSMMYPSYKINVAVKSLKTAMEEERYEDAIEKLKYLTSLNTNAWLRQHQLAQCYLETDQPELALERLDLARKANKKLALDTEYGRAYLQLGDFENSKKHFDLALKADPYDPAVAFYMGQQAFEQDKLIEAAEFFQNTAGAEEWNERAEPYRMQIREKLLGTRVAEAPPQPAE